MRWTDIDLDAGVLRVQHTLEPTSFKLVEPKTAEARHAVELTPRVVAEMRAYRKRMLAEGHPHELVFCSQDGEPLRASTVTHTSFWPILKAAKIEGVRFHDLRHTAATLMLAAGVNAKVVSERLRHARVAFTLDVYSHVLPTMQRAGVVALEAYLRRAEKADQKRAN